jgi:hypoxanthine phosphoribosyltransferase
VSLNEPAFHAYRGSEPPKFAHPVELEYARMLDRQDVAWEYEPRTFVLERGNDGRVAEAMTPDFYLPDEDFYVEVTVMRQPLVTKKNRKLRKLRLRYPGIQIELLYRRDLEQLGERHGFSISAA